MKKFRKVLDGLTTSSPGGTIGTPSGGSAAGTPTAAPTPKEIDVQETLISENFQLCKTVRHGFPYQPTALAFDPVQKILAIGSRSGGVRILGRPGVDCYCQHESGAAVLQLQFLINEGALVTACADDTLHLWNLRQRRPAVLHSLKFNRERITFCHLPFQSKWLYVGTERGNTHIVNIESFVLSGYVIMWNKAIELSTKTHPGPVVHLSDSPKDEGKLLIGFESGTVVQWDLRAKKADFRIYYDEVKVPLHRLQALFKYLNLFLIRVHMCRHSLIHSILILLSSSFPVFENPYPMDVHESPVTCTAYFADCPPDIIPILYSIGAKHKKTGYSQKEWPVITLQMLYKLKTSKVFEKPKPGEGRAAELGEEDPFAVQMVSWCPQSRIFCVVGISAHIILYRFSKYDSNTQIVSLEVRLQCDSEDIITPSENENNPCFSEPGPHSPQPHHQHPVSPGSRTPEGAKDSIPCLKVKDRVVRVPPGYQSELVIQLLWVDGEPPPQITSVDINSAYGLLAFGNCNGLAVVDYLQKTVLLCISTLDLYGATDPYQRLTRSPRRNRQSTSGLTELTDNQQSTDMDRSKSPTSDHVNGHCTSPTSQPCSAGKPRIPMGPEGPRLTRRGPGRPPFRKAQSAACMEISLPVSHTEELRTQASEKKTEFYYQDSHNRYKNSIRGSRLDFYALSWRAFLLNLKKICKKLHSFLFFPPTFSGAVQMLKGSVLRFAFLDCSGALIQCPYEVWRDQNAPEDSDRPRRRKLVHFSPSSSQDACGEGHLTVVCSERQAKVFLMPSQSCLFVHNITESSFVLRADVVSVCNSVCLACFCANGHVMMLSLPSLRPLMDVNYLPLTDMRIARTFYFTNGGQALYLSSPTEIQRITYTQEMCDNLQEMLGELFTPIETPEAQNRGFLKGFFGGNPQTFDREELCASS
uniref:Syntaxin binding protein 5L n=1 Tax=Oryzias sinensis TaxID=183150 RepID=A0A8C7XFM4_9TELE